jgi:transaldolase
MDLLSHLQKASSLAIDSADLKAIEAFSHRISDVTTNPTLLWKTAGDPSSQSLLKKALDYALNNIALAADYFLILQAKEILSRISGEISLEIDPRLSFDTNATLAKALDIARHLQDLGIGRDRYLLKIAGTWEGIQAVKELENLGVRCNVTVILSLEQAIAAHEAGASMIACYVARIKDWYDKHQVPYVTHPGIALAKTIYHHLQHLHSRTRVMAASFRTLDELFALMNGPILTISPQLLHLLLKEEERVLSSPAEEFASIDWNTLSEDDFRIALAGNPMATEKLKEALEAFSNDRQKLEHLLLSIKESG